MIAAAHWIASALVVLWGLTFAVALIGFGLAWLRFRIEERRRTDSVWAGVSKAIGIGHPDSECDVYAGATDEADRMLGLYFADRELEAAAERLERRIA